MSTNTTALHTARSSIGAVRQLLESLDPPELLLSAELAEVQVAIGEKLARIYARLNADETGTVKGRWDP